jgi:lactate permease
MAWQQVYDPLGEQILSTIAAAFPILLLIGLLLFSRLRPYYSAALSVLSASLIASLIYRMPIPLITTTIGFGILYGLLPIGWIVLNVFFLFKMLTVSGTIDELKKTLISITDDKRLLLLMVAFCFGAILEGAAGFGTPVAITASILIGLGFSPLNASFLSLLANTAPVAYGGLGTPIIALQGVTGLDLGLLSAMVGKLLAPIGAIIPIWLVWSYAGWKKTREILPVLLVSGVTFSLTQYLVSSLHGPWLAGVAAGAVSLAATILMVSKKKTTKNRKSKHEEPVSHPSKFHIWLPWLVLILFILIWGLPPVKAFLDKPSLLFPITPLHQHVMRMPPIVSEPLPESAVFKFNWMSATGTAIFLAGIINGLALGFKTKEIFNFFTDSVRDVKFSLLTICGMMTLGFITRYSGMDATLGLAFASVGIFYPFFGTLLGWLGVAITGSDTSSNMLFGSLQTITARQLGFDPAVMAAANSAGGVMGKMIDAQSIVIASTSTRWFGHESEILRKVIFHSTALVVIVGLIVTAEIYWL